MHAFAEHTIAILIFMSGVMAVAQLCRWRAGQYGDDDDLEIR
jgi:hypothetical protein